MTQTHPFQQKLKTLLLLSLLLLMLTGCGTLSAPSTSSGGNAESLAPLPVIASGRIYVNTGQFQSFDTLTGKRLNLYEPGASTHRFRSDPVVVGDTLYIAGDADASGTQTAVYALQETNGAVLWQTSIDAASVLGAANGLVYIYGQDKSHHQFLMALFLKNGRVNWQYQIDPTGGYACLVITSDIVYFCPSDTSFVALNGKTGKTIWQRAIEQGPIYGATQANNLIYLNERGGISAYQVKDGTELWHTDLTENVPTDSTVTPVVAQNVVYTIASDHSQDTMYALHAENGHVLWSRSLTYSGRYGPRPLAVTGDLVLYANVANTPSSPTPAPTTQQGAALTALRASDGSTVWQSWIGGFADPSLGVDNQTVYAISQLPDTTTYLNAWQVQTGKLLWKVPVS